MPRKPYKISESEPMFVQEPAVAYHAATDTLISYSTHTPLLQPDEDLRRAITFDQLLESTYKHIDNLFAGK